MIKDVIINPLKIIDLEDGRKCMEIGIIAIGWSGEWRQFFNGLIILLALLGHRLHGERVR